jgi:hypothetical protein
VQLSQSSRGVDAFYPTFFYWHQVLEAFALTIPRGAQTFDKEFPASAPQLLKGVIQMVF